MGRDQRVPVQLNDDLGHPMRRDGPARRVVSLVPSLTESVAVTRPDALAGATIWCTHPAGLDVPRVRGTKNPDLAAIAALSPDVVLANQEENRRVDVDRLRSAGIPVWVTVIRSLDEACPYPSPGTPSTAAAPGCRSRMPRRCRTSASRVVRHPTSGGSTGY
jgi:ABC-type Fe3+-hydroxamate transport system substrate-binding protein